MIGEYEHGKKIGQHYFFLPDGSYYKGITHDDIIIEGEYISGEFKYQGQFENYELTGEGREHYKDYDFQGEYD